jgi:DNA-directed RNA polymerase subunit RPC12/RpoP
MYKPVRLVLADWKECSHKKHVGVWQSIFIARRDEDIWCPDCGLKIAKHEGVRCSHCGGGAIVVGIEPTKMLFTHHEPLFKLELHCTERGESSHTYAVISGYTPVTVTSKNKQDFVESKGETRMLEYEPREDVRKGLHV